MIDKEDCLKSLKRMSRKKFEKLCIELLESMGFKLSDIKSISGDILAKGSVGRGEEKKKEDYVVKCTRSGEDLLVEAEGLKKMMPPDSNALLLTTKQVESNTSIKYDNIEVAGGDRFYELLKNFDVLSQVEGGLEDKKRKGRLIQKGDDYLSEGNYDQALEFYDQAISEENQPALAFFKKGKIFLEKNSLEKAKEAFQDSLDLDPENPEAWAHLGDIYRKIGEKDRAVETYDKALDYDEDHLGAWRGKGKALYELGMYDEALLSFERILEIEPKECEAWNDKGLCHLEKGEYKEALDCFNSALSIEPGFEDALLNKALVFEKLDKINQALDVAEKLVELYPKEAEYHYMKGAYLKGRGEVEEAWKSIQRCLQLDPNHVQGQELQFILQERLGKHEEKKAIAEEGRHRITSKEIEEKIESAGVEKNKGKLSITPKGDGKFELEISGGQEEIMELKEEKAQLERKLEEKKDRIEELEEELERTKRKVEEKEESIQELRSKGEKAERLSAQKVKLKERLDKKIDKLEEEKYDLERKVNKMENQFVEMEEMEKKMEEKEKSINQLVGERENLKSRLEKKDEELKVLREKLEEMEKNNDEIETLHEKLDKKDETIKILKDELERKNEGFEEEEKTVYGHTRKVHEAELLWKMGEEEKALELAPKVDDNRTLNIMGCSFYDQKDTGSAEDMFEDARPYLLAVTNLEELYFEMEKYEDDINIIEEALESDSLKEILTFWEKSGESLRHAERFQSAIMYYEKAENLESDPLVDFLMGKARCEVEKGNWVEGVNTLEDLDSKEVYPELLNLLGVFYYKNREYEKSHEVFDIAVKKGGDDAVYFNNLGSCVSQLENFEEGLKLFEQALELRPDDPTILNNLGFCLLESNKVEEALDTFDRALDLDESDPVSWYNKGIALKRLDKKDWKDAVERAVDLDPDFQEAKTMLKD